MSIINKDDLYVKASSSLSILFFALNKSCKEISRLIYIDEIIIQSRWGHLNAIINRIDDDIELLKNLRNSNMDKLLDYDLIISYCSLDIETFFIVMRSFLENIANLNKIFYPEFQKILGYKIGFYDQINEFKINPEQDAKLAQYFIDHETYFKNFSILRNDLAHGREQIITINSEEKISYTTLKNINSWNSFPVKEMLADCLVDFLKFIDFYANHQRKTLSKRLKCYEDFDDMKIKEVGVIGHGAIKRWVNS